MKKLNIMLLSGILSGAAFTFQGCETRPIYCTYAVRSNRCDISKDVQNLCFKCNGTACPPIENKEVYLQKGEKDSCLVSLGTKLSECTTCAKGDSIVVLQSIAK